SYYFGNELLVAPVIKPTEAGKTTSRDVFLPAGNDWIDFWTHQRSAGGDVITWTESRQDRFPLFIREGGILPMLLNVPETLCDANYINNPAINAADNGLQFLVYPRDSSRFTVHDGTLLTCQVNGSTKDLALTSPARSISIRIFGPKPASVTRDGSALTEHPTKAAFDAAPTGWHHELSFTSLKFPHPGGSTVIRL
ncbi:MAG: glycoside hydrolase family 31 protein, partial [Verrucomicrobiota bacterium]|nr:glycoside hydrolase family 31 protein [Verrucomicrobiota bacterium]